MNSNSNNNNNGGRKWKNPKKKVREGKRNNRGGQKQEATSNTSGSGGGSETAGMRELGLDDLNLFYGRGMGEGGGGVGRRAYGEPRMFDDMVTQIIMEGGPEESKRLMALAQQLKEKPFMVLDDVIFE